MQLVLTMTDKPKYTNKPQSFILKEILTKHAEGKPLSADETRFLDSHQRLLSNPQMDSAAGYYLKNPLHRYGEAHSFILPHEILNKEDVAKLKKRIKLLLDEKNKHVEIKITPAQFLEFKKANYRELILYHGNQFLSNAPFIHGGIPHIIYFQWGNLFGVAKYVVLAEERALKSNVFIYFEDMHDRLLEQCVNDYKNAQHPIAAKPEPEPNPASSIPTPTLSLSRNKEKKDSN